MIKNLEYWRRSHQSHVILKLLELLVKKQLVRVLCNQRTNLSTEMQLDSEDLQAAGLVERVFGYICPNLNGSG